MSKGLRVLLTGNRGYVGSVLAPMLVEQGHDVTGLDAGFFCECAMGDGADAGNAVRQIDKDIRDIERGDVEGFDAIIHLAGLSNDPLSYFRPSLTHEINFLATTRLARLAKAASVGRFIFASSCSVYGDAGEAEVNEESPVRPLTPYAKSKADAEKELSAMADDAFHPVFLRGPTVYGFSRMIRFDLVVNNLVAWAVSTGKVYLKSKGDAWRPMAHVRDFARYFLSALTADTGTVRNQVFNAGVEGENFQVIELANLVKDCIPGAVLEFSETCASDPRSYRVCSRKIQGLSASGPEWTLKRGIEDLYKELGADKVRRDDFEGHRYDRLQRLQGLIRQGRLDSNLRWTAAN